MIFPWYTIENAAELDSPSLIIYKDRVQHNIGEMIRIAGSSDRLVPHVKTYKMIEVVHLQRQVGITRFKAATIAEAEMVAQAGAAFVLIAHPLVGPKAERLVQLQRRYPLVQFATLVDCQEMAAHLNAIGEAHETTLSVWVDINNGMNRTGHLVNEALLEFYLTLHQQKHYPRLHCDGLHVYDGNLRQPEFAERKQAVDAAFEPVADLVQRLQRAGVPPPMMICGGTPSFTSHVLRESVYCSPGTCVFSDWGYGESLPEQPFQWAALLFTRVISKPRPGYITTDLGHKAVASENPLNHRVKFLNLTDYELVSQSEEHLVLSIRAWDAVIIGDVLYGVPYHICPTVNLYNEVYVANGNRVTETWQVVARNRRITV